MTKIKESIFIYPTDTVWGIGAPISSKESHQKIAKIKQTGEQKPLSVLFFSLKQLREFFSLPEKFDDKFLSDFFALETTVLFSKDWARKEVPTWVIGQSEYIGCRYLKDLPQKIFHPKEPITTTSFNITGHSPCLTENEAKKLQQSVCPNAHFLDPKTPRPSGQSSTIIKFISPTEWIFIRKGTRYQEVEKLLACDISDGRV